MKNYLSEDDLTTARRLTPILCVDMFIYDERGILLMRRKQEPYKGMYSIIGGRVLKDECIDNALARHLLDDTGLFIREKKFLGYHEWDLFDDPRQHPISLMFHVTPIKMSHIDGDFFKTTKQLPKDIDHPAKNAILKYRHLFTNEIE